MVKSLQQTVANWQRGAANATPDYTAGVNNTTVDWQNKTMSSSNSWATGVQNAVANNSFANGVSKVSTQQWKQLTAAKSANWTNGIRAAPQKFSTAMGQVLQNISNIVSGLPQSGPRGSEENFKRSELFQRAMAATRTGSSSTQRTATSGSIF